MRSNPGRSRLPALVAVFVLGCGGESESPMEPMEPEIVTDPPPPVLIGRVLVTNTFTVPPTEDPLLLTIYSSGGVIPADVGSTAGRLLVFSLRDASRPDFVCTDLSSSSAAAGPARSHQRSDCVILVVEPTEEEGFVSVESSSGRDNYYLQSSFRLLLNPEPA